MENLISYWKGFINHPLNAIVFILSTAILLWSYVVSVAAYLNKKSKFY